MRLSEAMRLGAMMKPQGFGRLYDGDTSCAMGAVYDAVGVTRGITLADDLIRTLVAQQGCPECSLRTVFYNVIAHLNDQHRWTRERIADWVETLEPAERQAVELEDSRAEIP